MAALGRLHAFVNKIEAQHDVPISDKQVDVLLSAANVIIADTSEDVALETLDEELLDVLVGQCPLSIRKLTVLRWDKVDSTVLGCA